MNPSFAATQWLARDREDEIRREASLERAVHIARREQHAAAPRGIPALLRLFTGRAETKQTPAC